MDRIEREKSMLTPIEIPQTQFDKELPVMLQRTSCGIASLYTGLRYMGYRLPDYSIFARDYVSSARYSVPTYFARTQVRGTPLDIPIDYYPSETTNDLDKANKIASSLGNGDIFHIWKKEGDSSIQPQMALSLSRGFDHRGVNPFLHQLGLPLKAEIIESSKLPDYLDPKSFILASIRQNELGYPISAKLPTQHISTHIVPILQIGEIGTTKLALFADPVFINPEDALQVRSVQSIEACMEKYTIITPE